MRLINTQTLALEEFFSDIPPYAVLSHRWETEEVTFQDYPSQIDPRNAAAAAANPMKGFKKIRYCIDQAKADGLGYCWVDTCCIDKSSSAELSEAINSMYAWYRNSRVCYIYLADVTATFTALSNLSSTRKDYTVFREQFESSGWFSRGWTLQELLASDTRVFYSARWQPIFPPESPHLIHLVMTITGIPRRALERFSSTSGEFSVAMRMSWASSRKTTRAEDMAYCLMGIFDINMPLLYGEGGPKAFLRLQEEIIKKTHDHSIFCWSDTSATTSTYRGLLARSPAEFSRSSAVRPLRARATDDDITSLSWDNNNNNDKAFGMTNRGLRITLPLYHHAPFMQDIRVGHGEFYARLDCTSSGRGHHHPCFLLLAHLGHGNFARVGVDHDFCYTKPPLNGVAEWKVMTKEIFVHEKIDIDPTYISPRLGRIVFPWTYQTIANSVQITHVYPRQLAPVGLRWIDLMAGAGPGAMMVSPLLFTNTTSPGSSDDGTIPIATAIFKQPSSFESLPHLKPGTYFAIKFEWRVLQNAVPLPPRSRPSSSRETWDPPPHHLRKHLGLGVSFVDPKFPSHLSNRARAGVHPIITQAGGGFSPDLLGEELEPNSVPPMEWRTVVIQDQLVVEIRFY